MKDSLSSNSKRKMKYFIFLLKLVIFFSKIVGAQTSSNNIQQTQNFTRVTKYSDIIINYATVSTTPNGDLIYISSHWRDSTTYYYYGLKKNGRAYFLNNGEETPFKSITSDVVRNEGRIFGIKLNTTSNDKKEYIVAFGNNNANFELYDFDDNDRVYKIIGKTFFGTEKNSFHYSSIFPLKNEPTSYIISTIESYNSNSKYRFLLTKCLFYNKDISTYEPIRESISEEIVKIFTACCFESKNNFIFCFYLKDNSNIKISVYNYNLNELNSTLITSISDSTGEMFYRSVHFVDDAGAFAFMDEDNNFAIQFKKNQDNSIEDYFATNPKITIINNNYSSKSKIAAMIKLKDKKICLATISSDNTELNLFMLNNYFSEFIKIRHYNIKNYNLYKLKIREELYLSLYNDLIAMAFEGLYDGSSTYAYSMVLSYPNSTDFSIDITDNLISFINPIIKLYQNCKIENNIFGYFFSGYKIYNFTERFTIIILTIS